MPIADWYATLSFGNVTIFSCEHGEVHISDEEMREAGIISTFLPRWTNPEYPQSGLVTLAPQKNVDILLDFLTLYARDCVPR